MMKTFRHEVLSERSLSGLYRAIPEEPLPVEDLLSQILDPSVPKEVVVRELLPRIFFTYRYPSPGDLSAMDLMLGVLRRGDLKVRREFVSTSPELPDNPPVGERTTGRTIESEEHKAMKRWVRAHLKKCGIPVAGDEVSKLGYEVDVGCLKRNVFVECGDTEPSKVLEFLRNGIDIGILQYESEEILWFLTTAEFQRLARLERFL